MAREQQPTLVLMDIQLPGISGVEAFRELRVDPTTADEVRARHQSQDR
jgi:CheY-like chemotaxis protein